MWRMFLVIYFLFVIVLCVFCLLVTIVILHMHLRAEHKPVAAMPAWVSRDSAYDNFFSELLLV